MTNRSILCPNCTAPVEVEDTQAIFTCPYCQFSSKVEETQKAIEHYMVPVNFDQNEIRNELVGDILKHPGTPDDLHQSLRITKINLAYYPYWIITVHNRTEYSGEGEYATYSRRYKSGYRNINFHLKPEQGVFDDEREFTIYAAEQMDKDLFEFEISTRGKRFFQKQEAEKTNADIVPSILDLEQAKTQGIQIMREVHRGLVLKEITRIHEIRDNPEVRSVFLMHIPFYFIEFEVQGKNFSAKLDASTGRTVITQIPRKASYVAQIVVLAAFFGITGLAGIFMIVNSLVPAIAGFLTVAGLAYSARIIHMGLRRRYREAAK